MLSKQRSGKKLTVEEQEILDDIQKRMKVGGRHEWGKEFI